jgi:uncharacterized membrane protein
MLLEVLLAFHILSAVVFVGNIITGAFWKVRADRSGNLETIALTTRAVQIADRVFTAPGIVVLLGTGIAMVGLTGWERFQQLWLGLAFILFIVTGIIGIAILTPLQNRMARLAREGATSGTLDPAYHRASRTWAIWGGIATLLPIIILFLMVMKPTIE